MSKFVNESEGCNQVSEEIYCKHKQRIYVGELMCTLNIIIMCNSVCELCTTYVMICSCFCLVRSTKL